MASILGMPRLVDALEYESATTVELAIDIDEHSDEGGTVQCNNMSLTKNRVLPLHDIAALVS